MKDQENIQTQEQLSIANTDAPRGGVTMDEMLPMLTVPPKPKDKPTNEEYGTTTKKDPQQSQDIKSIEQEPSQKETDPLVLKFRESFREGKTINGIFIEFKEYPDKTYYKLTFPDGEEERKSIAEFEFYFDLGESTLVNGIKQGFSEEGSTFLVALGIQESRFGQDNGGEEYHNMFSIMGGEEGDLATESGILSRFDSWDEGYNDGLVGMIIDSKDKKGNKKYPELRNLLESSDFTLDEANKAFGQGKYHPDHDSEISVHYAYDGNEKVDFAKRYASIAYNEVIPMMLISLQWKEEFLVNELKKTDSEYEHSAMLEYLQAVRAMIRMMERSKEDFKEKLDEH